MNNKNVFATNLRKYMALNGKSRKEVCKALGFSYYTFSDWVNGKKYPRMDKVEMLANYFEILKSDLIEEKTEDRQEMHKKNDILTDIVLRARRDEDFLSVIESVYNLDKEKLSAVKQMLAFLQ